MTDPAIVLDLIDAFRRSKAMFTAATLGVFDRTPVTAAELGIDERLLDACVGLGLLQRDGNLYRNTEVAEAYLKRTSPQTLVGYVTYSDRVLYSLWGNLADAVREGTPRWKQTYGTDGSIFSHFFRTPEAQHEFLSAMHSFGTLSSPKIVTSFDLSPFRRMVDLGGATGHLPMAAVNHYPNLQAAVFDLPNVLPTSRQFVDARIELIAGDFFNDPLPPADLYSLGRILHDWSEPKIRLLLGKIYDTLPSGGGLLIVEKLLLPDKSGPVPALMQSLNMLVATEGRERTLAEYEALLQEAGFTDITGQVTGLPLDAILALKR